MYDFSGKVALITGGARKRGIGRGTALRLARDGADIAVCDILTADKLDPWDKEEGWRSIDSLADEIKGMGRRAIAIWADVTKAKEVDDMVAKVAKEFGRIDILVNNAGVLGTRDLGFAPIVETSEETWNRALAVNLTGVFLMSRAVARQMIKQGHGGKIISLASRHGKQPIAKSGPYGVTKAGVINFSQALALELGQYKINVNAVCPGPTASWGPHGKKIYENVKSGLSEEEAVAKAWRDAGEPPGVLGGWVHVSDVVNAIAFLASDESNYMTGQAINVTGGRIMMR